MGYSVLRAGIEPALRLREQDFKSCVSTSSTTGAIIQKKNPPAKTDGLWAEDRARTGHPDLGKVVLYQLSYFRVGSANIDRKAYSASTK